MLCMQRFPTTVHSARHSDANANLVVGQRPRPSMRGKHVCRVVTSKEAAPPTEYGKGNTVAETMELIDSGTTELAQPSIDVKKRAQLKSGKPQFSFPLAMSMSKLAFEAYRFPIGANGLECCEVGAKDPSAVLHTTFFDGRTLTSMYKSILHIKLVSASLLPDTDPLPFSGTIDPVVVLRVGSSVVVSSDKDNAKNPQWNESAIMYCQEEQPSKLQVVLDDLDVHDVVDVNGAQATSMTGDISLANLQPGQTTDLEVVLKVKEQSRWFSWARKRSASSQPTVKLQVTLLPLSDPALVQMVLATGDATLEEKQVVAEQRTLVADNLLSAYTDIRVGQVADTQWAKVAFIDCPKTSTQAWVCVNKGKNASGETEPREVLVAFPGTHDFKDQLTDLYIKPRSMDGEDSLPSWLAAQASSFIKKETTADNNQKIFVHSGFYNAYSSVKAQVIDVLKSITTSTPADRPWKVYVTGHSLGGAHATLCSYDLAQLKDANILPGVTKYTFGQPRVGNKAFADACNSVVPDSWRVVNGSDPVPCVPPVHHHRWWHVGSRVHLLKGGESLELTEDPLELQPKGTTLVQSVPDTLKKLTKIDQHMTNAYTISLNALKRKQAQAAPGKAETKRAQPAASTEASSAQEGYMHDPAGGLFA